MNRQQKQRADIILMVMVAAFGILALAVVLAQ